MRENRARVEVEQKIRQNVDSLIYQTEHLIFIPWTYEPKKVLSSGVTVILFVYFTTLLW